MTPARREALLKEYGEVGSNFRLLTDIRFKLLALLPIAAAAAAALKGDSPTVGGLGFSLFGLVATLGLATYNARNDQLYDELVARAASIERSLGLADGSFANRPRPWFAVHLGPLSWPIDHRRAVATIYAASAALWLYGLLAPLPELCRRGGCGFEWLRGAASASMMLVNVAAFVLAILLTLACTAAIAAQRKRQAKLLREWAAEAVSVATGLTMKNVLDDDRLLDLCARLAGENPATILARAQFYSNLAPESLGHFLQPGSAQVAAAGVVALLTDLPARWLFDCATNRRGALGPR